MTRDAFQSAWDAVRVLSSGTPALSAFTEMPEMLESRHLPAQDIPASRLFGTDEAAASAGTLSVLQAAKVLTPSAHWLRHYTEDQVGADFMARYGFFELAGPDGHLDWPDHRAFFAYWGPGLHYDWHHHAAEELYIVLSGEAEFHVDGLPTRTLGPGETSHHASHQSHALTTRDRSVTTLVLWRGEIGAKDLTMGSVAA